MQARSALFDLYGDYLRPRGGRAPVAALVKLLAPLGIAPPAVRTAVSRMVRQGWLHPLRLVSGPGYLLTPKAARRLDEAAARIYRTGRDRLGRPLRSGPAAARRSAAPATAERLAFLGTGCSASTPGSRPGPPRRSTPCSPRPSVAYERFSASHAAGSPGAAEVVGRAWDLAEIGRPYEEFVADAAPGRDRGHRAQHRRGGVRGPVPAGARLAVVPVPRPAAARRRCCRARWPGVERGDLLRPARRPAAAGRRPLRRALPRTPATRGGRVGFSDS